ncbi:hypothetical protein SAMN05892883_1856 [Jatrophihabitans sp. GAS493]|uniref:hypothetical protein n=1 Tax=Jatrophihabitans sp. GAS493 TaxID=1907575 RepID=UPI000BB96DCD|nr:hypothetical protein [Jatrophihabitans sp. GAS493]SOD72465.1 hypothetical protein SAMN05892883_1856 [Jatrophihabitans sp. GAS493]
MATSDPSQSAEGSEPASDTEPLPTEETEPVQSIEPATATEPLETVASEPTVEPATATEPLEASAPVETLDASAPVETLDEAELLRRQNAELLRRNSELEKRVQRPPRNWANIARAAGVFVLVLLGAVCATLSVPAIWSRNLVLNTDRYVQTMTPLASNPGIQAAVIKAVDQQFAENVDVKALLADVLPPRAAVLAGPLQSAANSLVNTVATKFVESDAFVTIWVQVNKIAHTQIVALLTGKGSASDVLSIQNGNVLLNLAPIVEQVKTQLVQAGLGVAARVPAVGVTIQIAEVKGIEAARTYVHLLDRIAHWLPLLAIIFFVLAAFLSRRHRRTVVISALSTAFGMLLLGIGLAIGKSVYLNDLPLQYLTESSAGELFDTVVRYLRDGLRLVFVGALLVTLIVWLTGPTTSATKLRRVVVAAPKVVTEQWVGSPAGQVIAENRVVFSVGVAALAALVLLLWSDPSVLVVVVIAVITGAILLVLNSFRVTSNGADPDSSPAGDSLGTVVGAR